MSETRSWNSVIRWLPRRVILSWKVPLKDGNEEDRWGSKKRDGNRRRHIVVSDIEPGKDYIVLQFLDIAKVYFPHGYNKFTYFFWTINFRPNYVSREKNI